MKNLCVHLILIVFVLSSCGKRGGRPRLEGAWLGEGTFSVAAGSKDVKAQLEILSDGTYRFLFLEPGILMMTGMEKGSWSRIDTLLTLVPSDGEKEAEGKEQEGVEESIVETLQKSSPKKPRIKQLKIADDLSSIVLSDGPLELNFTPNRDATRKLEDAGEVMVK